MARRAHVLAAIVALAASAGCGGAKPVRKPAVPPMEETAAAPARDAHLNDVKEAVAGQLDCPVEHINVTCIRNDAQGECVAVRGNGCDRTVEYQFGDV